MSVSMVKAAKVVLDKYGDGVFDLAELYLLPDHSGSMQGYYSDPRRPVTHLAEQVLSLGLARLDPDGMIPLVFWSSQPEEPVTVTEANLHGTPGKLMKRGTEGIVEATHKRCRWGSTNMAAMIRAVTALHTATGLVKPGLAVVQSDGEPDDQFEGYQDTISALVEASQINLFLVFVGYGRGFKFLQRLNRGGFPGQIVDNAYAFEAGHDPLAMSDEHLYDELLREIPQWRRDARGKVQGSV